MNRGEHHFVRLHRRFVDEFLRRGATSNRLFPGRSRLFELFDRGDQMFDPRERRRIAQIFQQRIQRARLDETLDDQTRSGVVQARRLKRLFDQTLDQRVGIGRGTGGEGRDEEIRRRRIVEIDFTVRRRLRGFAWTTTRPFRQRTRRNTRFLLVLAERIDAVGQRRHFQDVRLLPAVRAVEDLRHFPAFRRNRRIEIKNLDETPSQRVWPAFSERTFSTINGH